MVTGLNDKIQVEGYQDPIFFMEVAKTPRTNTKEFTPKASDARFSFFGLRGNTTTAHEVVPLAEAMVEIGV